MARQRHPQAWLIAAAVGLAFWTTPSWSRADPVITPIVTALVTAGINAGVATFVVTASFNLALSYAASAFSRAFSGSSRRGQERQASVTQLSLGETPPVVIYGTAATGRALVGAFDH